MSSSRPVPPLRRIARVLLVAAFAGPIALAASTTTAAAAPTTGIASTKPSPNFLPPNVPPPQVSYAIVVGDLGPQLVLGEGAQIQLGFSQDVTIPPDATFTASDFTIAGGSGGSLGTGFTVRRSSVDRRQVVIQLGAGAEITAASIFSPNSSAIDVSASLGSKIIDALYGHAAKPSLSQPVRYSFRSTTRVASSDKSFTLQIPNDRAAAFTRHALRIDAGEALAGASISLAPGTNSYDLSSVVEVIGATSGDLTVEIHPSQVHADSGQILRALRPVRIIGSAPPYTYQVYSGPTTWDVANRTFTISLYDLLRSTGIKTDPGTQSGIPKEVVGGLPELVVDPATIFVQKSGASRAAASVAVLTPGPEGLYTRHRVELPGYAAGSSGVSVHLRQAQGYERFGFIPESGAIFSVDVAEPLPDSDAATLEIEFQDSVQDELTDLRTLDGVRGPAGKLRLVQFNMELPGFEFVAPTRYESIAITANNTIRVTGLRSFAPVTSVVYGLAVDPAAAELTVPPTPTPVPTLSPSPTPSLTPSPSPTPFPTPFTGSTPAPTATPTATPDPRTPTPSHTPLPGNLAGWLVF